jgi:hypothetical protein
MADCVWLIHSDAHGNPNVSGPDGHFVRVSSNPHMHALNQMHAGGNHPDADCAETCLRSALEDRGRDASTVTLEHESGMTGQVTTLPGLVAAASDQGLQPMLLRGDPAPNWIMNPAWGGLLDPSHFAQYMAASQHWMVVLQAWEPWQQPAPTPTPPLPEDDDMGVFGPAWNSKRPGRDDGDIFLLDANGRVHHFYESAGRYAQGSEDLGIPEPGDTVLGVTGLYTGTPTSFIACRALVRRSDGSLHVCENAGNYLHWNGFGGWVLSG